MRYLVIILCLLSCACANGVRLKDLNCEQSLGSCSASLEPEGYDWYAVSESECGVVTVNGKAHPFCGYKAYLGRGGEYEIESCRVCVWKPH